MGRFWSWYWFLYITRPNVSQTLHKLKYVRVSVSENRAESYAEFMLEKEWIILGNISCDIQITLCFVTNPICASLLLICKLCKVWLCLTDHLFYESRIIIAFRYSAILQREFGEKKKKMYSNLLAMLWFVILNIKRLLGLS